MPGTLSKLALYGRTSRHLRPSQLAGRARRLIPASVLARGSVPAPGWRPLAAGLGIEDAPQGGPAPDPAQDGVFRAIGLERPFGGDAFWTGEEQGLLLLFHLHGFAELAGADLSGAAERAFWERVLGDWLDRCSSPGAAAWHPFPLSGRLIRWSAALSTGHLDDRLAARLRASMSHQLLLLRRSVEHDIGGNHVLRNAAALVVAGTCLEDAAAARQGTRLLEREVPRQVLADGGHEERSPSYQREVLADLDAARTVLDRSGAPVPDWSARVEAMQSWLAALTGPDGGTPLFNDAWEAPAGPASRAALEDLSASGYVVGRRGGEAIAIDIAPLCPPHLPAHAHADALSVELWADGRRVVADPGAGAYAGPDRDRFRATTAHATVAVGGADQCAFWGPFRAAGLPTVTRRSVRHEAGWLIAEGEHDGYAPVVHRRTVAWHPDAGLVLVDRVLGGGTHAVVSTVPLAPGAGTGPFTAAALGGGTLEREPARYAPYLGTTVATERLVLRRAAASGAPFGIALLRAGHAASLDGDWLTVSGSTPLGLRIG